MFYYKSFIALNFTFRSVIDFELIFTCGTWEEGVQFHSFGCEYPVTPGSSVEMTACRLLTKKRMLHLKEEEENLASSSDFIFMETSVLGKLHFRKTFHFRKTSVFLWGHLMNSHSVVKCCGGHDQLTPSFKVHLLYFTPISFIF